MFNFFQTKIDLQNEWAQQKYEERPPIHIYIYIYTSFICSTVYLSKFHTHLPSSFLILSKDWIYPRWPFPFLIKYLFPPRDHFLKHLATTDCEACLVERKYMIPLDVFKWHFLTESRWCTDIGGQMFSLFMPVYSWHYGKILWLLHSNVFALLCHCVPHYAVHFFIWDSRYMYIVIYRYCFLDCLTIWHSLICAHGLLWLFHLWKHLKMGCWQMLRWDVTSPKHPEQQKNVRMTPRKALCLTLFFLHMSGWT